VLFARISYDPSGEQIGVDRQLYEMRLRASKRTTRSSPRSSKTTSAPPRMSIDPATKKCEAGARREVDHCSRVAVVQICPEPQDRADVITHSGSTTSTSSRERPSLELRTAYGRGVADLMTASTVWKVKSKRTSECGDRRFRAARQTVGFCPYGWDRVFEGIEGQRTEPAHETGRQRAREGDCARAG